MEHDTTPYQAAMSCQEVDRLLLAYIDGLLPVDVGQMVTAHLLACDRHRADNWKAVIDALRRETGHNQEAA